MKDVRTMQHTDLLLICIIILALTGGLDSLCRLLEYNRVNIAMLAFTTLIIGRFEIVIMPELGINPATVLLPLFLLASAVKRCEARISLSLASILLTSPLLLLTALLTDSNPLALTFTSCLAILLPGIKRPSLSMFSTTLSALVAYYLSVVVSTCLPGSAYSVFESADLYNTQIFSMAMLALIHWAGFALREHMPKKA